MPVKLLVTAGPNEGQAFAVMDNTSATIGRGDTCNIMLDDPTASRNHCTIECYDDLVTVKDNGSKAGTKVNGKPIVGEEKLGVGDSIHVGSTRLRISMMPTPKAAADSTQKIEETPEHTALLELIGTKLAHFEIGDMVALSNTGVVFRATDFKEEREVALKIYFPEFAESEEDLQRFIRAVKTMLPMRHTNVVTLYGGGKTGPYCWMSMEFVDGEVLRETIRRIGRGGKIDWRPALNVMSGLARGLDYIHHENIIHRNLSPGNILFTSSGAPKLASLILAKALSGALAKQVTVGGQFLGDVAYLAPEQVGAGGAIDGRADIYSLGTLVYALLVGRPPFQGANAIETATWVIKKEPTSPRKFNPQIPEPIEKIVMRLLAKKPEARYQSATDLISDLDQLPKY